MRIDHLFGDIFTAAAATGDGQVSLNFVQRRGPAIHDVADLAITDGMTNADVHSCDPGISMVGS